MYVRQGRDCIQAGDQTDVAAVCCQFLTQQPYLDRIRWERFLCYASWIHHVIDWTPGSDSGLLHVLLEHNGKKTFLPSLKSLSWAGNESILLSPDSILLNLASPSLRHFDYRIDPVTSLSGVEFTLTNLSRIAPDLRQLHIAAMHRDASLDILPYLAGFGRLRKLDLVGHLIVTPAAELSESSPASRHGITHSFVWSPVRPLLSFRTSLMK